MLDSNRWGWPSDGDTASIDQLRPIETVQLYERISALLISQIRSGYWRPGQRLPPERDLARSLNVSRPSLREALAALQVRGILETRHGAGSRVSQGAQAILEQLNEADSSPRNADVSPVALLEARSSIEPVIASLAAERFRDDGHLDEYLSVMREHTDFTLGEDRLLWCDADRLFHRDIARYTGNPVLSYFASVVADVMDQPLWRRLRDQMLSEPGRLGSSADEHARILEALRHGDAQASCDHARRHVEAVRACMGLDSSRD